MGLKNIVGSLLSGGTSNVVTAVGDVLDNLITNKEELVKVKLEVEKEVNRHLEILTDQTIRETEAYLKDTQSARDRETQIAVSTASPLINKVVTPILAMVVVLLTFIMWYAVLFKQFPQDSSRDIILFVLGSLSAVLGQVISYYYGSSSGSREKQDMIKKLIE